MAKDRKLRYALGLLLAWILPLSVVWGLGIYMNGWRATFIIFGIVLLFVAAVSLGNYLMTTAEREINRER